MIGWERPPLDELGCSNGTFVYGYRVGRAKYSRSRTDSWKICPEDSCPHSSLSPLRCLSMGTSTNLSWAQRAPRYCLPVWPRTAVRYDILVNVGALHNLCFSFHSVFWRIWPWAFLSASVSKHWDPTVSVQMVSKPRTGLQSGRTAPDPQCPYNKYVYTDIRQQVSIILSTELVKKVRFPAHSCVTNNFFPCALCVSLACPCAHSHQQLQPSEGPAEPPPQQTVGIPSGSGHLVRECHLMLSLPA